MIMKLNEFRRLIRHELYKIITEQEGQEPEPEPEPEPDPSPSPEDKPDEKEESDPKEDEADSEQAQDAESDSGSESKSLTSIQQQSEVKNLHTLIKNRLISLRNSEYPDAYGTLTFSVQFTEEGPRVATDSKLQGERQEGDLDSLSQFATQQVENIEHHPGLQGASAEITVILPKSVTSLT
jgi:hypothetical protein